MIPHARFNEVNESLKQERAARLQLEEELARARGTQPSTVKPEAAPVESQAFDFDAAEKRYMDALMDGDTDAAAALRKEIRAEERKDFSQQSEQSAKQAAEAERQRVQNETAQEQTQRVLDDAIEKYPFLDHASEAADSDAIEDVIARRDLYIKQGVPFAQALEKAVEKVAPRYQTETPAPTPASSKTATVDQIKRNLEREKRIPAAMPGVGERGKDIDYANLSEDEFDSLSEQEKRKARGDFVKESA